MQQTWEKIYFRFATYIMSGNKIRKEKHMPIAPPSGHHIKHKEKTYMSHCLII